MGKGALALDGLADNQLDRPKASGRKTVWLYLFIAAEGTA